MSSFEPGDWVAYHPTQMSSFTVVGKVLEVRPDDMLVIGEHDNDPDPDLREVDEVVPIEQRDQLVDTEEIADSVVETRRSVQRAVILAGLIVLAIALVVIFVLPNNGAIGV